MEDRIRRLLETYTFLEVIEYNDITLEDLLETLYYEGIIEFPPEPL